MAHRREIQKKEGGSIFSSLLVTAFVTLFDPLRKSHSRLQQAFDVIENICLSLQDLEALHKIYKLVHSIGYQPTLDTKTLVSLIDHAATHAHRLTHATAIVDLLSDIDSFAIEHLQHLLTSSHKSSDAQLRLRLLHLLAKLISKISSREVICSPERLTSVLQKILEQEASTARKNRETASLFECMGDVCLVLESLEETGNSSEVCVAHRIAPFIVRGLDRPKVLPPCLRPLLCSLRGCLVVIFDVLIHHSKNPNAWQSLPEREERIVDACLSLLISNETETPSLPACQSSTPPLSRTPTPQSDRMASSDNSLQEQSPETLTRLTGDLVTRLLIQTHVWFLRPPFFDHNPPQSSVHPQVQAWLQARWRRAKSVKLCAWPLTTLSPDMGAESTETRHTITVTRREEQLTESIIAAVNELRLETDTPGCRADVGLQAGLHSDGSDIVGESKTDDSDGWQLVSDERTTTSDTRATLSATEDDGWGLPRLSQVSNKKRRSTGPVSNKDSKLARVSVSTWTEKRQSLALKRREMKPRKECQIANLILRILEGDTSDVSFDGDGVSSPSSLVWSVLEHWQSLSLSPTELKNLLAWILAQEKIPFRLQLTLLRADLQIEELKKWPVARIVKGDGSDLPLRLETSAGLWASIMERVCMSLETETWRDFIGLSETSLLRTVPLMLLSKETRDHLRQKHDCVSVCLDFDMEGGQSLLRAMDEVCLVIVACRSETRKMGGGRDSGMGETCTETRDSCCEDGFENERFCELWMWSLLSEVWAKVIACLSHEPLPTMVLSYMFTCHVCMCEATFGCMGETYKEVLVDCTRDWSSMYKYLHPALPLLYNRMLRQSVCVHLRAAWNSLESLMKETGDYDKIVRGFNSPWTAKHRFIFRRAHLCDTFYNLAVSSDHPNCPYSPLNQIARNQPPTSSIWMKYLLTQDPLQIKAQDKLLLAEDLWWFRLLVMMDGKLRLCLSADSKSTETELPDNCLLGHLNATKRVQMKLLNEIKSRDEFASPSPLDFVSNLVETIGKIGTDTNTLQVVSETWHQLKLYLLTTHLSPSPRLPLISLILNRADSARVSVSPPECLPVSGLREIDRLVDNLENEATSEWIKALSQVVIKGRIERDMNFDFAKETPPLDWRQSLQNLIHQQMETRIYTGTERETRTYTEMERETRRYSETGSETRMSNEDEMNRRASPSRVPSMAIPLSIIDALVTEVESSRRCISVELLEGLRRCLSVSPTGSLVLAALGVVQRSKREDFMRPENSGWHRFAPFEDHEILTALLQLGMHETSAGITIDADICDAIIKQVNRIVPSLETDTDTETAQSLKLMALVPSLASDWAVDPKSLKQNHLYYFTNLQIMADCLTYVQDISNTAVAEFTTIEFEMCSAEIETVTPERPRSRISVKSTKKSEQLSSASSLLQKHQQRTDRLIALASKIALKWFALLGLFDRSVSPPSLETQACQHAARLAGDLVQYGPVHPTLATLWTSHWRKSLGNQKVRLLASLLPWTYKITASLSVDASKTLFAQALLTTLENLALYFPLETLAEISLFIPKRNPKSQSRSAPKGIREERCVKVIESICRFSSRHSNLVGAFKKTFDFYNHLAESKFQTKRSFKLSESCNDNEALYQAWQSCRVCSDVPVLTLTMTPPDTDAVVSVSKWEDQVLISTAGKSLPKILTLFDTDGYRHRQLVKSDDDVRQDRTVQTVLTSINCLFSNSARLITYRIIPISNTSGVIEFMEECFTLRDLLFKRCPAYDDRSCHDFYYPNDSSIADASRLMMAAGRDSTKLLTTFQSIDYHPCLSKVFLNLFPTRRKFLSARKSYRISTASQSVTNWILGVGDRHLKNIMIKTTTGEVTHIDFGYIFEAGRLLPLPERVPFRWSKEIRDLMTSEDEFRTQAVSLLKSLRSQEGSIVSAVSIFADDLLPHWHKDKNKSTGNSHTHTPNDTHTHTAPPIYTDLTRDQARNLKARKGILRMRHKIRGLEFSFLSRQFLSALSTSDDEERLCPMSPPGEGLQPSDQLRVLLTLAASETLLSQMYVGWTPWI